ncbi:MAG: hypothetical protein JNJ61_06770 [Anaerolineae bacterium]|nr:hypothetical protein [Anaerolineae bacterium]
MMTTVTLAPVGEDLHITCEARMQAALEGHFRALRERIAALIERDGCLPVVFWMQERQALANLLVPLHLEGLRLGIEQEMRRPRFPALTLLLNINGRTREAALHLSRDAAQSVTLSAAECADAALADVSAAALVALRAALRIGALSDGRAERLAGYQMRRAMAAGVLLAQRAVPLGSISPDESETARLCV